MQRSNAKGPRQSARRAARLFELGGYWLGRERLADTIYVYWYDAEARRTRRETTGLHDLEAAKVWLATKVLKEAPEKPHKDPAMVTIASVRAFYMEHHGRHMRSHEVAELAFRHIGRFLSEQQIDGAPKVADFGLARQEQFMRWCATVGDMSPKSISTYLTYYRAALRFASKPRMVLDGRGGHREAQFLETAPYVKTSEPEIAKIVGRPVSKPREYVPDEREMARVLDEITAPHMRRYVIMALNTWARPEAITELRVGAQVDFERGLVHLNPAGRRQNNKVRPTIRLTDNLRAWLQYWNADAPICKWTNDDRCIIIRKIDNRSLKDAAERAKVSNADLWNRYVFRHFMATKIRSVPGIEVSREQRAEWMGHADPDHRTTQRWYESMDPDHLLNAARATDAILSRLNGFCMRSLVAPTVVPGTRIRIVENAGRG